MPLKPEPRHDGAPRRADARASRAAIVCAATSLFEQKGIDVPFDEIARAAGVGRSTLYRHFPTREAIFEAMLEDLVDRFVQLAREQPETPEALLELFDALIDLYHGHPAVLAMVARPAAPNRVAAARRRQLLEAFRVPLATARAAGTVRDDLQLDDLRILLIMLSTTEQARFAPSDRARARDLVHRAMLR